MATTYNKNSIVDTLKSQGQASDFASRAKLAAEKGIQNYTGTAEQNTKLIGLVKAPVVTSPIIEKQKGIIQSTQSTNAKDTANGSKVDSIVTNTYGAPTTPVADPSKPEFTNGVRNYYPPTDQSVPNNPTNNPTPTNTTTPAPEGAVTTPDGKALTDTVPSGFSYTLPPLDDPTKKRMYSPDGHVYIVDSKGVATLDPIGEQEYIKNAEYNAKVVERNAMYDSYKKGLDQAHQSLIDSIKVQADQQRAKMDELNKRTLGLKRVQGFRTGSAEYTPEIDTGILKAEEEEGIARLAEIDANMKIALAQAVSAKSAKDFELLEKRLSTIDSLQKAKEEAVQNIYKNYIDNAKMISDKIKEADTLARAQEDQAIQKLDVASDALVTEYDAIKDPAKQKIWLDLAAKKLGVDPMLILGSMQKKRLAQQNTQSLINKREDTGSSSDKMAYSSTELKKLRSVGINPSDTGKADAYLYNDILPEDYDIEQGANTSNSELDSIVSQVNQASTNQDLVDDKGYLTAEFVVNALKNLPPTVDRLTFLQSIKDKLYLDKYKYSSKYGLSKSEWEALK